mmetsp:Transcript_11726/g.27634  ORF Transcript_11726/g.27634 Transcript_11726/m.27634 type:complete len:227 (+) Transcript_11726:895-1575(+)
MFHRVREVTKLRRAERDLGFARASHHRAEEDVHRRFGVWRHRELRRGEADVRVRGLALELRYGRQRVHDRDGPRSQLPADRVEVERLDGFWGDELQADLIGNELFSLGVGEKNSDRGCAFPVGVDVELVVLGLSCWHIEGADSIQLDLLRRLRWLHQRDLHPESLGLLQPIRERHTLHVRRLALHLCAQLPILPRLRRAFKRPHKGIAVRGGDEESAHVLLRCNLL